MEDFITMGNLENVPTTTAYKEWVRRHPDTKYTTKSKFTKAMALYGFTTVVRRTKNSNVARFYKRTANITPTDTTISCKCGHTHIHRATE